MKKLMYPSFKKIAGLAAMLIMLSPGAAFAQEGSAVSLFGFSENQVMLAFVLFLAVALVFAVIGLLLSVLAMTRVMSEDDKLKTSENLVDLAEDTSDVLAGESLGSGREARQQHLVDNPGFWYRFKLKLTDSVPVDQEESVMTDHEYDGIWELDNSLPPWWKALFVATIIFAVAYMSIYHVFGWGKLQEEEYQAEVRQAKAEIEAYMASKGGALNESNVTYLDDEASLAKGKAIYDANCVACHGAELQGTVGPNLVNGYWIHGGSIGDIFKTIRDGVPSKGMISWKNQLSAEQIQQVSSYIISQEGTEPAGAKEPQGTYYERN